MIKFSKIAAVLAIVPALVLSNPVSAASPGQLAGGDNYVVKNVTKGSAYANTVSAACNDEVQYSMQLSNTQFGALENVTLRATLPGAGGISTATASTDLGGQSGTTDTATVNLTSGANQTLQNGTTVLYDDAGHTLTTLDNTIATSGVNIGTLEGSTTKYVNFKAKVNCDTPVCPPGTTGTPPNCVKPPVTPPTTTTKTTPPAAPVTPSVIPSTGPEAALTGIFGSGALGYGIRQWFNSRRSLRDLLQ